MGNSNKTRGRLVRRAVMAAGVAAAAAAATGVASPAFASTPPTAPPARPDVTNNNPEVVKWCDAMNTTNAGINVWVDSNSFRGTASYDNCAITSLSTGDNAQFFDNSTGVLLYTLYKSNNTIQMDFFGSDANPTVTFQNPSS